MYPIALNRDAKRTCRGFAVRHELAHVLSGSVDEPTFLADAGFMSAEERVADLFAVADLVPGWLIGMFRKGRTPWYDVLTEIRDCIADWAEGWPAERLEDRAQLRLRLYRECGV